MPSSSPFHFFLTSAHLARRSLLLHTLQPPLHIDGLYPYLTNPFIFNLSRITLSIAPFQISHSMKLRSFKSILFAQPCYFPLFSHASIASSRLHRNSRISCLSDGDFTKQGLRSDLNCSSHCSSEIVAHPVKYRRNSGRISFHWKWVMGVSSIFGWRIIRCMLHLRKGHRIFRNVFVWKIALVVLKFGFAEVWKLVCLNWHLVGSMVCICVWRSPFEYVNSFLPTPFSFCVSPLHFTFHFTFHILIWLLHCLRASYLW